MKTVQQSRFKHIEFSWMLESNQRIHRVLDNLNIPVTKRWRVYERPLYASTEIVGGLFLQRSQFVAFTQSE